MSDPGAADERYLLPIFLFLSALLAGALVVAWRAGAMASPLRLAVVAALAALHVALHWRSPAAARSARAWAQYALAQGALAVALVVASADPSVWAVTTAWLVGEAVGLLPNARLVALSFALYGALGVAALLSITTPSTSIEWLGALAPTLLFVALVVLLYKRQSEARERAQALVAELAAANRRVEELTRAQERQRMARELHDTLAQDVAGLVLQLEAASAHLGAGRPERAGTIIEQAMARARTTLHDARAAIDDLRAREGSGHLAERLNALCREHGVALEIEGGAAEIALPPEASEQVERLVAEALANVRAHARATRATVVLRAEPGRLSVRVADDGVGFDPERLPPGHYGVRGMRERAALLGGALSVASAPGAGTTIELTMPFGEREGEA